MLFLHRTQISVFGSILQPMQTRVFLLVIYLFFVVFHTNAQPKWVDPTADTVFAKAENIILDEHFDNTALGKLPPRWRMISKTPVPADAGKLAEINGYRALVLLQGNMAGFEPVLAARSYLNNSFTIEYDFFQDAKKYNAGCATSIALRDSLKNSFEIMIWSFGRVEVRCVSNSGKTEFQTLVPHYDADIWHHVAISCYNKRVRCYINGRQIISTISCMKPTKFSLEGKATFGVKNVQIAVNGPAKILKKTETEQKPAIDVKKPEPVKIPVSTFDKFETETKLTTYAIHFESSQSTITPESMPFITQMAEWLKEHADIKLEIGGHTDSTGNPDSNMVLSLNRAIAVKSQFEILGVPGERITTKGYGSDKPISSNSTEEGKALNRRVEFVKQE